MTGCSAFGQTFYISLFGGQIRETFELTSGQFGSYYGLATLASGLSIFWLGSLIDRFDLRYFAPAVIVALAIACLSISFAPNVVFLVFSLYLLRLTGQGFMTHTAMTSAGRYFDANRGKALSITSTGFPIGQAIFPITVLTLTGAYGWRETWMFSAIFLLVLLIPLVVWLLKGQKERHSQHLQEQSNPDENKPRDQNPVHWTRKEVLFDIRFYILLPILLSAPFIMTGLFFHQVYLAVEKGWTLEWMATGIICFSIAQFFGDLVAGYLTDRYTAKSLYGWASIPMILGLLVLASGEHKLITLVYLTLTGLTAGMGGTFENALWPELYGTKHLGAIRSLSSTIMIFGTAASPALYGWLIDRAITINTIAISSAVYTLIALIIVQLARRRNIF